MGFCHTKLPQEVQNRPLRTARITIDRSDARRTIPPAGRCSRCSWVALISCLPLWRNSYDFNAPKVKSISQIHNRLQKLFKYIDLCVQSLVNFSFFCDKKISNFPRFTAILWLIISCQKGLFWQL